MTADERLALILAKVERAKRHIDDLRAALVAYKDSKPGKVIARREAASRGLEYLLESFQSPPTTLAPVVGDVLQNLRSALDHLAYQLVLLGTGQDASEERIYFPIASDAKKFGQLAPSQLRGARREAVTAIEAVQPYSVGNDYLTRLHRLNIIDKHRALLLIGSAYRAVDVMPILKRTLKSPISEAAFGSLWLRPADTLFPLKVGAVLFVDGPDAEPDPAIQFMFDVYLSEPAVMGDPQPLLKTVQDISVEVERVIRTFLPLLR
jgi:hypothetical protein